MFRLIRQSNRQLRLWLLAAAAILAFVSVLEAGHVHGVFTQADDQCTLCQHSVSLDKLLGSSTVAIIQLLLAVALSKPVRFFIPQVQNQFALIRAPPTQLHAR